MPAGTDTPSSSNSSSSSGGSCSSNDSGGGGDKEIPIPLPVRAFWARVRRGEEVYLHVFVVKRGGLVRKRALKMEGDDGAHGEEGREVVVLEGHDGMQPLHGAVPLVKRQVRVRWSMRGVKRMI